jgi:hypothetical protein
MSGRGRGGGTRAGDDDDDDDEDEEKKRDGKLRLIIGNEGCLGRSPNDLQIM